MNDAKQKLRTFLLKAYRELPDHERICADREIINAVLALPTYQSCDRIFLFVSVGSEIDTRALIEIAHKQGKTVALPKSQPCGIMDFYEYTGSLSIGRFHIPEPDGERLLIPDSNDLMIVPGLAFTPEGHRIGYGGGYYDRYLSKHPCVTVGLCRDRFLMKELPVAWNDLSVDCVITESAVFE